MLVYLVGFSILKIVKENVTPVGPVHTMFTVTGTSTAGLNSTVQVRVMLEPMTFVVLLDEILIDGAGTIASLI